MVLVAASPLAVLAQPAPQPDPYFSGTSLSPVLGNPARRSVPASGVSPARPSPGLGTAAASVDARRLPPRGQPARIRVSRRDWPRPPVAESPPPRPPHSPGLLQSEVRGPEGPAPRQASPLGAEPQPAHPNDFPPSSGPPQAPAGAPPGHWLRPSVPPPVPGPAAQTPPPRVFAPCQIIAWVGDQPIQVGDLMPVVEQALAPQLEKLSPEEIEAYRDEIETQKQKLLQAYLQQVIERKLLYLDFVRSLPADKRSEILKKLTKRAEDEFYEKQLPAAIEKAKVTSAAELEAALRRYGSSIDQQKRAFIERMLGQSMLAQSIDRNPEVTPQEMRDYYNQHRQDYFRPARARWEKLTVRFDRFPSKAAAWAALGEMGNQVLRGASFAAVAKRHSQGVDADDGGYHDWTSKGSLASDVLDKAIFSLPVGQLSPRLEDERGFHIVRVIERHDAGYVPFLEAQVEIKKKLRKQKIEKAIERYVSRLRREIRVWTIFDQQPQSGG